MEVESKKTGKIVWHMYIVNRTGGMLSNKLISKKYYEMTTNDSVRKDKVKYPNSVFNVLSSFINNACFWSKERICFISP